MYFGAEKITHAALYFGANLSFVPLIIKSNPFTGLYYSAIVISSTLAYLSHKQFGIGLLPEYSEIIHNFNKGMDLLYDFRVIYQIFNVLPGSCLVSSLIYSRFISMKNNEANQNNISLLKHGTAYFLWRALGNQFLDMS